MGRHSLGRHRKVSPRVWAARGIFLASGLVAAALLVPHAVVLMPMPAELVAPSDFVLPTPTSTVEAPAAEPTTSTTPPPVDAVKAALVAVRSSTVTQTTVRPRPTTGTPPRQSPTTTLIPPSPVATPLPKKVVAEVPKVVASVPKPVPASDGLVAIAKGFVGHSGPYVFGGKDPVTGMDCSGFVWNVFKRAGMNVPYRSSSALRAWARPVPPSEARPGDLAFWPGHVAIYAGGGMVVDDGGPPGVTFRKIWAPPTFGRIP